MKKIFISLIILSSFFIFSNSVNAEEISQFCEYTEPCLTTEFIKEQLAKDINNQIGYYDQDDIAYIIAASKSSITDYKSIKFYVYRKSRIKFDKQDLQTGDVYYNSYTGNFEIKVDRDGYLLPFINGSIELSTNEKINLSDFSEKIKFEYITRSTTYSILGTRNTNYAYFTNIDLLDSEGNVAFAKNDDKVVEKQTVFDDVIYGTKYSKVELVFDIKGNMEQSLDFGYDFHLVQANGEIDELNSFNSPYFIETSSFSLDNGTSSLPKDNYFRVVSSGLESCISDSYGLSCYDKNNILIKDTSLISNSYSIDKFTYSINNNPLEKVTSSLKFVLDLEFNSSVIVDAFFKSSIPFDVIYHERTSFTPDENYYDTIDLTGKYGVLFLPKLDTSVSDLSVRTLFRGIGHLDVQHRTGIDPVKYDILSAYSMNYCHQYLSTQKQIPYSCNAHSGEFEFYLNNDNLNQSLFFINSKFEESATAEASISYDKRYYVYYVFDTPTSVVKVTNPNTNEETFISLENFYNFADVDVGFLKSLIKQISDFFHEKIPALNQFKMIISLFTYHADYEDAPTLEIDLNSIGINQKATIIDFSIFQKYRSTVFFWEMLGITTITIVKVTDNIVKAFKGD